MHIEQHFRNPHDFRAASLTGRIGDDQSIDPSISKSKLTAGDID